MSRVSRIPCGIAGFKVRVEGNNGVVERLWFDDQEIQGVSGGTHGWGFAGEGPRNLTKVLADRVAARESLSADDADRYEDVLEVVVMSWPRDANGLVTELPPVERVVSMFR